MQSCAKRPIERAASLPCGDALPELFSKGRGERHLHIRGRLRIDLPKYRVRGLCTIRSTPGGDIRIDFHHSSLFGAYREDATIFLRDGELGILDRGRGLFFGNDSTLALLRDNIGCEVFPEDIQLLLLLGTFACTEIGSPDVRFSGSDWSLSGVWRGRNVEIEGHGDGGPARLRYCWNHDTLCYTVSYEYLDETPAAYPSGITVVREYGSERLVLNVRDVKLAEVGEAVFELYDSLVR